jgi:hypothetical protein
MNLTPQQLVQQHVAEIKRLATTEPVPAYIQGALEYTLEVVIKICPQARELIEQHIKCAKDHPTPAR